MNKIIKPVVLITGCSHGLGFALAEVFNATNSFRVLATAREGSIDKLKLRLEETENLKIRKLDVTSDQDRHNIVSDCFREWKGIDILINNAAVSYRSVIEHMDEESEMHQINTNYLGPMALTRLVLPTMREKGRGKIINISSVSGMMAMPTMASYSASKHALEGASEALWYEMKPFGINVSLVQPGFIQSDSYQKVYFSKKAQLSEALEGPYADYYAHISPFIEKIMKYSRATPEKIALQILKIVKTQNPPLWVPVTPDAIMFFYLRKMVPRTIFHGLMNFFLPKSQHWGHRFSKASKERLAFRSKSHVNDYKK